ncbi:MAG: Asp-tRNA(Asn)/Glu-tRNA(Gln) amidotransferase subunit GatC [Candidatus Dadabacteria bacterium]|nr:Asp-tRNA(Asn)/Glu-tRNA(Gln) amidotransferase subunit GatC [Candidatus Dadabacteria bacterium]NIQ14594.1 Asp-tRNA(Asn)/Glu-tRNA(Gln) amidotransferase subunit GatC [Candidatus Dadabacteria bacterium]
MKISKKEVENTAELARLEFEDDELQIFTDQLGNILEYIKNLNELDTEDIEPTSHAIEINIPLREDVVNQWINVEEALQNAPEREDDFFVVPKVIED